MLDTTTWTRSTPLPLLGPHLTTFLNSTIAFFLLREAAYRCTHLYLGPRWDGFDGRTRRGWASHVCSTTHAVVIVPLALKSLGSKALSADPVFGYDPFVGHVLAFSSGYFIWDTVDSYLNSTIGFVIHGAACLAVYLFSFSPFLAGFGPPFLLWELSTPLLNTHWFMDKLNLTTTYPRYFLVNSMLFILTFFLARIVYGGYQTILFFQVMWDRRTEIAFYLHLIYCSGAVALNALNWLWFSKMCKKMVVRLQASDKEKRPLLAKIQVDSDELVEKENGNGNGELPGDLPLPVSAPPSPVKARSVKEMSL